MIQETTYCVLPSAKTAFHTYTMPELIPAATNTSSSSASDSERLTSLRTKLQISRCHIIRSMCMGCLDHTNCSGGLLLCEESGMTWPTQYKTLVSHTQVNIFTAKFLHNSLHHAKIRSLYLNPKVRYAYLEIRPNNYNHYRNVNMSYSSCTTYLLTQPLEENTGSLIFVARSQTALTYLYCLVLLP